MAASHQYDQSIPVPHTQRLSQTIQPGQALSVRGNVLPDAKRAEVNLLSGGTEIGVNAQAVLHVSLRFDEGKIIFNSFQTNGGWGNEERESIPFKKGQNFDLRIRVLDESFEISCDGKKVHEYKHRAPFQSMEYSQIKGDITLTEVQWGGQLYSLPWETGFYDNHLGTGQRIRLYGVPKGDRWILNLIARNGDILFHFNPRFREKVIVRNSRRGNTWEHEEKEGPFPFEKNREFDLIIINDPHSIQMFANNERIGTFQHRTSNPTEDYTGMRIEGELEMTGIKLNI
ncbi:hypothetical protein WR25_25925 [Diploscapter pachys]|uniref:Galectin n=1 Tax=Diploscapter pachys TaxID=2018661 RepID=A0A2A2KS55_9BILA|nr:hypothetical protein WR25_25925 [Diploscapter pachys]